MARISMVPIPGTKKTPLEQFAEFVQGGIQGFYARRNREEAERAKILPHMIQQKMVYPTTNKGDFQVGGTEFKFVGKDALMDMSAYKDLIAAQKDIMSMRQMSQEMSGADPKTIAQMLQGDPALTYEYQALAKNPQIGPSMALEIMAQKIKNAWSGNAVPNVQPQQAQPVPAQQGGAFQQYASSPQALSALSSNRYNPVTGSNNYYDPNDPNVLNGSQS